VFVQICILLQCQWCSWISWPSITRFLVIATICWKNNRTKTDSGAAWQCGGLNNRWRAIHHDDLTHAAIAICSSASLMSSCFAKINLLLFHGFCCALLTSSSHGNMDNVWRLVNIHLPSLPASSLPQSFLAV